MAAATAAGVRAAGGMRGRTAACGRGWRGRGYRRAVAEGGVAVRWRGRARRAVAEGGVAVWWRGQARRAIAEGADGAVGGVAVRWRGRARRAGGGRLRGL
jgi:hypothetical protein